MKLLQRIKNFLFGKTICVDEITEKPVSKIVGGSLVTMGKNNKTDGLTINGEKVIVDKDGNIIGE